MSNKNINEERRSLLGSIVPFSAGIATALTTSVKMLETLDVMTFSEMYSQNTETYKRALAITINEFKKKNVAEDVTTSIVSTFLDRVHKVVKDSEHISKRNHEVIPVALGTAAAGGTVGYLAMRQIEKSFGSAKKNTSPETIDSRRRHFIKRLPAMASAIGVASVSGPLMTVDAGSKAILHHEIDAVKEAAFQASLEYKMKGISQDISVDIISFYIKNAHDIGEDVERVVEIAGDSALPISALFGFTGLTAHLAAQQVGDSFAQKTKKKTPEKKSSAKDNGRI